MVARSVANQLSWHAVEKAKLVHLSEVVLSSDGGSDGGMVAVVEWMSCW
jgi:hypothetical protein